MEEEEVEKLKLFMLPSAPNGLRYDGRSKCEPFSDWCIRDLPSGIDVAAYWYVPGEYDGSGHIVYRIKGKWQHADCSHCSCFGPTENITDEGREETLDELLGNCSDDLIREGLPALVTLLKENGFN